MQGWRATYIHLHKQMASGAMTIVEYVKARACYDSLEVTEYQKAMALLISMGLQFSDVQIFLLAAKHSVLVNLLGMHYCLLQLKIQVTDYVGYWHYMPFKTRKIYQCFMKLPNYPKCFQ